MCGSALLVVDARGRLNPPCRACTKGEARDHSEFAPRGPHVRYVTIATVSTSGEQQRIVKVVCDVHLSLPGIGREVRERLHSALHVVDRKIGVIVRRDDAGIPEFILLTPEGAGRAARDRAQSLLAKAATAAGISAEQLDRVEITQVVTRERDLTGGPRAVEPPAGVPRVIDLGDRGKLCALHDGPLGDWIVYLMHDKKRVWAGRDLLSVLTELFDLPHGRKATWVYGLIETLAGRETPLGVRYPCPCCDSLTLLEPPSGTYATCPVCWWEDDGIQFRDLDYRGGANQPSLREARASVEGCGVSAPRFLEHARPPLPGETP